VRDDIERADAMALAAVLNRDLVRPWVQLENGPQQKYPKLRIGRAEKQDNTHLADDLTKLVPLGLKVQMSDVRDRLGFSDPDEGAEVLIAPAPTSSLPFGPPGSIALQAAIDVARRDAATVEQLAREAEALATPATDDLIEMVRAEFDAAESLDDLRERLAKLKLPKDKLASAVALARVMAQLTGRAEIADA
jgi:phage gp29-like protein